MDFKVIDAAGLTQEQFARLVDVSRITVNTWVNGHYQPGPKMRDRVKRALRLLQEAVEAGKLPVDTNIRDVVLSRHLARISVKLAFPRK